MLQGSWKFEENRSIPDVKASVHNRWRQGIEESPASSCDHSHEERDVHVHVHVHVHVCLPVWYIEIKSLVSGNQCWCGIKPFVGPWIWYISKASFWKSGNWCRPPPHRDKHVSFDDFLMWHISIGHYVMDITCMMHFRSRPKSTLMLHKVICNKKCVVDAAAYLCDT